MSTWKWELDEDEFDDESDIFTVHKNAGVFVADKMKKTKLDEVLTSRVSEDLSDTELLIGEMRAVGIHYAEGTNKSLFADQAPKWLEEDGSTMVFQGKVPVFLGKDHFYVKPKQHKKKKEKGEKKKSKKEKEGIEHKNSVPYSVMVESISSVEQESNANAKEAHQKKESTTQNTQAELEADKEPKIRRTVAEQLLESGRREKQTKKKSFKKFNDVNFNPEEPNGPTIGMADHQYFTARQILTNRFAN